MCDPGRPPALAAAWQLQVRGVFACGQRVCCEPHTMGPFLSWRPHAQSSGRSICAGGQICARCAGLTAHAPPSCMQAAVFSRKSQICVVALICVAFRLAAGPGTHTLLRHNRHSLLYRMPSVPQMGSNSLVHPLPRLKFSQTAWRYRRVILKMLNLFSIYQRSFVLTERCTFCLS